VQYTGIHWTITQIVSIAALVIQNNVKTQCNPIHNLTHSNPIHGCIGITFEGYGGYAYPSLFGVRVPYPHFSGTWQKNCSVTVPQRTLKIHYSNIVAPPTCIFKRIIRMEVERLRCRLFIASYSQQAAVFEHLVNLEERKSRE